MFLNAQNKTVKGTIVSEYRLYKNPEGKTVQKNINWNKTNDTYAFSYGLGAVIVSLRFLILLGIWYPKLGFWGYDISNLVTVYDYQRTILEESQTSNKTRTGARLQRVPT